MNSTIFLSLGLSVLFGLGFFAALTIPTSSKKPKNQAHKEKAMEIIEEVGLANILKTG